MSNYIQALESCSRYVDEHGNVLTENIEEIVTHEQLVRFYKILVLIRQFDQKAVAMQRTGQMGTYPSCLGQEAFSTGIGFALNDNDVFVAYYRDQATQYLRGVKLSQLFQLWGGDERANFFEGSAKQDLPVCVPIATQITHAAGVATAMKARGEHRAVLATCGDGATSRGDFYESLNVAGVWQLPLVIVVNNNQWAISVPGSLQTAAKSIAEKAKAAGIDGVRVDGNDTVAVYKACKQALDKARTGKGATLIECVSYRLSDHTTADDATRYRDANEVHEAWEYEPIKRLQTLLHQLKLWSPAQEQALQAETEEQIEAAAKEYLSIEPQPPEEIFDYLFESLPTPLAWQKEVMLSRHKPSKSTEG